MGRLLSVEKAKFIEKNLQYYAQNKIGQYSKFLDKTPIFVTYYHINQAMSRADTGTGGIQSELGANSPVRFNKILLFPIYNIPELKPDVTYDETGADIELEINDGTILPGTLKPTPGDYFLIHYPGIINDFLFRVNNFSHNSIQSNDFYLFDADIKMIRNDLAAALEPQVVETYQTIFENIGTDDKCFIRDTDIDKVNDITDCFETIKQMYVDIFYDKGSNTFLYDSVNGISEHLYDTYLEEFLNRSRIFFEDNQETALVLSPADIRDNKFDYNFSKTLWNAILRRKADMFSPWVYAYTATSTKTASPFMVNVMDVASIHLQLFTAKIEAFHHEQLINLISTPGIYAPYTNEDLSNAILDPEADTFKLDYGELIILKYLAGEHPDIDITDLYTYLTPSNLMAYYYIPMILYILMQYHGDFFKKTEDVRYAI